MGGDVGWIKFAMGNGSHSIGGMEQLYNDHIHAINELEGFVVNIRERSSGHLRQYNQSYDLDIIWGIIFSSSKMMSSQSSDKNRFKNIVLPVIETNGDICSYIASRFSISEPYLISGSDLYEGDTMAGFEKMHYFEEILTSRKFSEFNYILPNSFDGAIEIDWQGNPVKVDIKSNCEWGIK